MTTSVPMNDFKKEYQLFGSSLLRVIDRTLKSGYYVLGKEVAQFEKQFARYTGVKYCIGVGNGLGALQIALLALGIGEGDEVITVSNTDLSTALTITSVGATPVFVDVDEYFHMDPSLVQRAITRKTKAILPVHLFGQTADMETITRVAKRHALFVVEDACQAHGASFRGKKAGSLGDLGCFSFYPTKNLGAYGDAGAITTNSKELYEKCLVLRNRGQTEKNVFAIPGINSRMDEIQAAILSYKLRKLAALNRKRAAIAARYKANLKDERNVSVPHVRKGAHHAYHLFVVRAKDRDALQRYLETHGVAAPVHYPTPIHKQPTFSVYSDVPLPRTETLSGEILSLPIHPFLTTKEVDQVTSLIKKFYTEVL